MVVSINGEITKLPAEITTLEKLLAWKKIPANGTAVALNSRLARRENWNVTALKDNDIINIISAAYGG